MITIMHLRRTLVAVLPGLLLLSIPHTTRAESAVAASVAMDRDLMEVTVSQLQTYYAEHRYTVTQVVQWHLARVHRYNGIYRAVETSLDRAALETAAREDAQAATGRVNSAPLWGVPIVIKANTSIAGEVTTDGWSGYTIAGH
jgi:amidase